jgi:hypothetical protein
VADFEETESKPDAGDEEEIEASFDGEAKRRFAIILLPRSQNFMHSIEHPSGGAFNEIVRHDATLPNPSNKVDTYALIDCKDLTINFRDKARTIAEAEVWVIPNMLLQCSKEPSSHEVIKTMEQIVEEIVEAAPTNISMNTVEALSRTKAMVAHSAELDERVVPQDIGRQVFKDEPQLIERYEAAAEVHELPEEISVRRAAARRLTKTHRIRTDTGIDIAFPSTTPPTKSTCASNARRTAACPSSFPTCNRLRTADGRPLSHQTSRHRVLWLPHHRYPYHRNHLRRGRRLRSSHRQVHHGLICPQDPKPGRRGTLRCDGRGKAEL